MKKILLILMLVLGAVTITSRPVQTYAYTDKQKQQAKSWLSSHGYSPTKSGAEQAYQDYMDGKIDSPEADAYFGKNQQKTEENKNSKTDTNKNNANSETTAKKDTQTSGTTTEKAAKKTTKKTTTTQTKTTTETKQQQKEKEQKKKQEQKKEKKKHTTGVMIAVAAVAIFAVLVIFMRKRM